MLTPQGNAQNCHSHLGHCTDSTEFFTTEYSPPNKNALIVFSELYFICVLGGGQQEGKEWEGKVV